MKIRIELPIRLRKKSEHVRRTDNYRDGVFYNVGEFSVMGEADFQFGGEQHYQ